MKFIDIQLFKSVALAIEIDSLPIFQLIANHPSPKLKVYESGQGIETSARLLQADIVDHIMANLVRTDNTLYCLEKSKAERIERALQQ